MSEEGMAFLAPTPLPYGTGNDMSNSLGWGASTPDTRALCTRAGALRWLRMLRAAACTQIDVWHVEASVSKALGGAICTLRGGEEIVSSLHSMTARCLLYMSLGADAQLVRTVEMHRTNLRAGNMLVYTLAGMLRMMTYVTAARTSAPHPRPLTHARLYLHTAGDIRL